MQNPIISWDNSLCLSFVLWEDNVHYPMYISVIVYFGHATTVIFKLLYAGQVMTAAESLQLSKALDFGKDKCWCKIILCFLTLIHNIMVPLPEPKVMFKELKSFFFYFLFCKCRLNFSLCCKAVFSREINQLLLTRCWN